MISTVILDWTFLISLDKNWTNLDTVWHVWIFLDKIWHYWTKFDIIGRVQKCPSVEVFTSSLEASCQACWLPVEAWKGLIFSISIRKQNYQFGGKNYQFRHRIIYSVTPNYQFGINWVLEFFFSVSIRNNELSIR